MPRGELPFISASFPRHSPPPHSPLGLHPRFFHKVRCRFLAPFSISSRTRVSSTHRPRRSYSLRTCLRAFPHLCHVPPGCTPFPPHGHRCKGTCLPKTQKKRAPFLGERCSFWVAKRSTFGRVVLTCATMGGHTGGKRVRRRGLACATCAVDLIDATLYFGIAAGESIFAHLAVAIDAAHHFAGGLFHTARGRLCGRGGRGRRRGGRARR